MPTDRQKICKCGINVGDFLNDIFILEGNLKESTVEKSAIYIPAFRSSMNSISTGINHIEEYCGINARDSLNNTNIAHNKIDQMEAVKDSTKFNGKKADVLTDLSRIRYGVTEKVRECSK